MTTNDFKRMCDKYQREGYAFIVVNCAHCGTWQCSMRIDVSLAGTEEFKRSYNYTRSCYKCKGNNGAINTRGAHESEIF